MSPSDPIDTARLSLALGDLRLPAIKLIWPEFAARADKEGWPAARFLAALTEHEMAERARRRRRHHHRRHHRCSRPPARPWRSRGARQRVPP